MPDEWRVVEGNELEEALRRPKGIEECLDRCQAVYVWRRRLRPPARVLTSRGAFVEWVEQVTAVPVGLIRDVDLTHYARLESLRIGGRGLTTEKRDTLSAWAGVPDVRRKLARFVQSLAAFTPPLYVGETDNTHRRVAEHLAGHTALREALERLKLEWWDVDFWYWRIGESPANDETADPAAAKARRTLLELIATRLALAPFVERPG